MYKSYFHFFFINVYTCEVQSAVEWFIKLYILETNFTGRDPSYLLLVLAEKSVILYYNIWWKTDFRVN